MQTRFTDYLKSLCESDQYLRTIKESVAAAREEKEPQLGKLGGIFKGFPYQYKGVPAIPQNTWNQYHNACLFLISIGHLEQSRVDQEVQKRISNLVQSILMAAMEALFDAKGRFAEEVVKLLDLQKILDVYKDQPEKLLLIKQQILYAYFSEIVLTNLTIEVHAQQHSDESKILQLALAKSMQNIVVNRSAEFTVFFQQMTKKRLCHSTVLEEEMAAAIKNISVDRMRDVALVDLKENKPEIIDFWRKVLCFLQEDPNNFLYVKSLYLLLGADLGKEAQVAAENYLAKHAISLSEAEAPKAEDKEDSLQVVNHLISARNNVLLLQRLIDAVRRLSAVPANRNFLDAVTNVQGDYKFLKEKTAGNLLLSIAAVAQTHKCEPEVIAIVEQLRQSVRSPTLVSKMFPPTQRRGSMTSLSSSVVLKGP